MDRGAWWATVHGVTKSRRRLKQLATAHGTWLSYKIILVSGVQLGIHHFYRLYPMYWRRDRLLTPVFLGFPGILVGKESACNMGYLGPIPGLGRFPGEGDSYPLQDSGLENSLDYIVHRIAKSWTRRSAFHVFTPRVKRRLCSLLFRLSLLLICFIHSRRICWSLFPKLNPVQSPLPMRTTTLSLIPVSLLFCCICLLPLLLL